MNQSQFGIRDLDFKKKLA